MGEVCWGGLAWDTTVERDGAELMPEPAEALLHRVRETEERERQVKAIGLASQRRWTQWGHAQEHPLSWKDLWQTDQGKFSSLLRSVKDLLQTPTNFWGLDEDLSCKQCGAPERLASSHPLKKSQISGPGR